MNDIYVGVLLSEDSLSHHGILGMKWGVRRYQNADGSLTSAGKVRYLNNNGTLTRAGKKKYSEYKKLKKSSEYQEQTANIYKKHDRNFRKIVEPYHKKGKELYDTMVGSKSFATGEEYEQAYQKYLNEYQKVWNERQDAIKKGKATYDDLMESYAKLQMKSLKLDTVDNGRELVKMFENMDFEEDYRKWRRNH